NASRARECFQWRLAPANVFGSRCRVHCGQDVRVPKDDSADRAQSRSDRWSLTSAGRWLPARLKYKKGISLVEAVIDPNLPPVRGDEGALKRAMQYLISNAIKYDGESRWARISAQMWAR